MLIGHLNRRLGFLEFKKLEIGTPVYEQGGYYYVWQEHEKGTYCEMVRYYPKTLLPAVTMFPKLNS